jgi:hypothetical protein
MRTNDFCCLASPSLATLRRGSRAWLRTSRSRNSDRSSGVNGIAYTGVPDSTPRARSTVVRPAPLAPHTCDPCLDVQQVDIGDRHLPPLRGNRVPARQNRASGSATPPCVAYGSAAPSPASVIRPSYGTMYSPVILLTSTVLDHRSASDGSADRITRVVAAECAARDGLDELSHARNALFRPFPQRILDVQVRHREPRRRDLPRLRCAPCAVSSPQALLPPIASDLP